MSIKQALSLALILLAPIPAAAGSLYPMECGNLRREGRSLSPSPLANPLKLQWEMPACNQLYNAVCNPVILSGSVIQDFLGGVRSYDRVTGARNWTWACNAATSMWNAPTYDAVRDRLYLSFYNGDTVALAAQTGNVDWYYPHQSSANPKQYSAPILAGGKLYVGNGGSGFVCLDPDTRAILWQFNFSTVLGAGYTNSTCTPAYDAGSIYLPLGDGNLFSLNATTGAVQWHVKQNLQHVNAALLSDEYVYILGNLSQVECRNRSNGSLVWTADTHLVTGNTNGNLALCGDVLIVPGDSHKMWGLNRYTGQVIWGTMLGGNFAINSPFVVCGKVYISACWGDFYCLDGQTGQIEWNFHHGVDYTFVGWAEADGQLFVADANGKMRCFTSVTPGNPANCFCNLSATPVVNYTPSPSPTAVYSYPNPYCLGTTTNTPTATRTATPTQTNTGTQTPTITPTKTPTSAPSTPTNTPTRTSTATPVQTSVYLNTDVAVGAALGVPVSIVDEARLGNYDPLTTYTIILLTKHCGCHPSTLFNLIITLTWDQIANLYGTDWVTLTFQAQTLTSGLIPELTFTPTSTPTITPTPTKTLTATNTFTPSRTSTPTNSPTKTPSPTSTNSPTLSPTSTSTLTNTATKTPTASPTSTSTLTSTSTPTLTLSPTVTQSPTKTPARICDPIVYPNPSNGAPIKMKCGGGPYDEIHVSLFTSSFRKVSRQAHVCQGQVEEVVQAVLNDDHGTPLANGLYIVEVETKSNGVVKKYHKKCLVLR